MNNLIQLKKSLALCFLLAVVALPATAQTDAKAKSILEGVSKNINSLKSLKAILHCTSQVAMAK
jgi:outer membrane lipoprotein-sorting protein